MTFNLWAVPFASAHAEARIDALLTRLAADEAAGAGVDVIGFQEAFTPFALESLHARLPSAGLTHIIAFTSGADLPGRSSGSGCLIASRYPIQDTCWHAYTGGRPFRLDQWDFQSGKGVGLARLQLPGDHGTADVYVSHLQAQYHDGAGDAYAAQRTLQALEAAFFIRATRRSDVTLLLADLNAGAASDVFCILTRLCGLVDAYMCSDVDRDAPPAAVAVRSIHDATFGAVDNTFSYLFHTQGAGKGAGCCCKASPPRCDINVRLDYVLVGISRTSAGTVRDWRITHADIRLRDYIVLPSGQQLSYSDHAAVYAELECCLHPPRVARAVDPHARSSHVQNGTTDVNNAASHVKDAMLPLAAAHDASLESSIAADRQQWRDVLHGCESSLKAGAAAATALRSMQISRCIFCAVLAAGLIFIGFWYSRTMWSPLVGALQACLVLACIVLAFFSLVQLRTRWQVLLMLVLSLSVCAAAIATSIVFADWPAALVGLGVGLLPWGLLNYWVATMMTSVEVRAFQRVAAQVRLLLQREPSVLA